MSDIINGEIPWDALWPHVDRLARPTIAWWSQSWRVADELQEDALHDFFVHLGDNDRRRLRRFRGATRPEFDAFIRKTAWRFARRWVRDYRSDGRREARAREGCPAPTRDGPTEADYARILDRLRRVVRKKDREKLEAVVDFLALTADQAVLDHDAKERKKLYRWAKELFEKYWPKIEF